MKIRLSSSLMTVVFCFTITCGADNEADFIEDINTAWTNRNYDAILSNINVRLQANSNDALALSLKMNYYLWADLNTSNAHAVAQAFTNAVRSSNRQYLVPLAGHMASKVLSIVETNTYTSAQRDEMHAMFPQVFPSIIDCVYFAAQFVQTNVVQFQLSVGSSNPDTGVAIVMDPKDDYARGSTNTSFSRIFTKETSVKLTAPATAGGHAFVEWRKNEDVCSTNRTITLTMPAASTTITAVYE